MLMGCIAEPNRFWQLSNQEVAISFLYFTLVILIFSMPI